MVSADTSRRQLRRTVVCLDDDPQVLSSLRRLLRGEPVNLLTTDKPETALDWVDHQKVDLLITDLRMPGVDGAEIIKVVEERSPDTRSLILTGFPAAAPVSKPLVAKPWNDAELKQRIRELTRPLPYVVLMPPEPKVRLALVGLDLPLDDLAAGWFERTAILDAELALIDAQHAEPGAALETPGVYKVLLTDDAGGERLRAWYDAGVDQVVRKPVSPAASADLLRRCVPLARMRRRPAPEKESGLRRLWKRILALVRAIPSKATLSLASVALVLGMLFAVSVNAMSAMFTGGASESEPFMDRLMRFSAQELMLRRWAAWQQVELHREMNDSTRRYYDEQLRNQRRLEPAPRQEAMTPPTPPEPRTIVIPVEVPPPALPRSSGRYGTGAYPGNGLPYQ